MGRKSMCFVEESQVVMGTVTPINSQYLPMLSVDE